jgi:hypothetical protein
VKFLVTAQDTRPRAPVRLFLASSAVLLLALAAQRLVEGELTPAGVLQHYLGSGDPTEALPLAALVESLHTGAFVYGFLLLVLGSLLVTSGVRERLRLALTLGGAASCALDLAAPFLVVWTRGAPLLRVASFALTFGFLFGAIAVIAFTFARRPS